MPDALSRGLMQQQQQQQRAQPGEHGRAYRPPIGRLQGSAAVPGRCWRLRWRDRVAWWLFAHVANDAVAHTTWDHYRWGRDSETVTWKSAGGAHAHTKAERWDYDGVVAANTRMMGALLDLWTECPEAEATVKRGLFGTEPATVPNGGTRPPG